MTTIPEAFAAMLRGWNERSEAAIRRCANQALVPEVVFVDPHFDIRGIDAWVTMVVDFHRKYPNARLVRTSGIDLHHDRARYSWAVEFSNEKRLDGFDAVAVDKTTQKIRRIDGFFGSLPPL